MEATIRRAVPADADELARMRRDFTYEDHDDDPADARAEFEDEFRQFLVRALDAGTWHVWVAEVDGLIASHVYVAFVDKVPRPIRQPRRIAYLTNVYTRPEHRGRGLGGRLLARAQEAAREADVELMVVWPSDESVAFYERHGFARPDDLLVWDGVR